MKGIAIVVATLVAMSSLAFGQNDMNPANRHPDPSAEAFNHFYNLDYDLAIKQFRDFTVAHPQSMEGWNYLAQAIFYSGLFDCGLMGSDLVKSNDAVLHAPKVVFPAEQDAELQSAIGNAQKIADARLKTNPRDAVALYELGITYGLRANYELLAKHAWLAGLRAADESRKLHEQVIKLDPNNYDARLIPGTHQYLVGTLPLLARMVARAAGVSGDRVEGLKKVELTAARGDSARLDAQILLAVLYRREHRSGDGIPILTKMTEIYPRNFLFRIELAKLYADTGDRIRATAELERIDRLIAQGAPGYCGSRISMIRRNQAEVGVQIAQLPQKPAVLASAAPRAQVRADLLK
jgi:tetratricopeptide (TPR) repeat protein